MFKALRTLLILLCLVATPSCAAVLSALPKVVAAVTDAGQIVDSIKDFVDAYFVAHPDAAKQKLVDAAILKAKESLNLALRTANGAQELDQKKVDEAFADFKQAYRELLALVGPLGVRQDGTAAPLKAAPGGDSLTVPEPAALTLKVGA